MSQYQKFKLIMELFEKYAELLQDQVWLEVVVFEIPRLPLTRQDQLDLSSIITAKVPAVVSFNRTVRGTIQVSIKRAEGE